MSQIPAFNTTDQAVRPSMPSRFQELSSEDFVRIIFTELSNQDPFQPNDTNALLEQLNSIRSIESDIRLTDKLEDLVLENQLASASSMIGKLVGGLSENADRTAGLVVAISRESDRVLLELDDGARIPIENVETIVDPGPPAAAEPAFPDDPNPAA